MSSYHQNQNFYNNRGGGGGRGGPRGPYRGGGRNYHGRGGAPTSGNVPPTQHDGQKGAVDLCKFYTRGSTCNNGSNCRQGFIFPTR
jgi:hypothetical protein